MYGEEQRWNRREFLTVAGMVAAAGCVGIPAAQAATSSPLPPRPFADPGRIRYDGKSLFLEGRPFFPYSGSFHYFRCAKPLWRARFEKIQQAGFNGVETYVAWNYHEREKPASLDDMSKIHLLEDLDDFLTMATQEFGLNVNIRPGPYVCGEWDTGGFPRWLLTLRPKVFQGMWLRSDDPVFMQWSRHWYRAVCPVIAPHQITHKKPGEAGVILFQIENEYDCIKFPQSVKRRYLEALVTFAREYAIDVPLFINWGKTVLGSRNPELRQVFDAVDIYPGWRVDSSVHNYHMIKRDQPDAPLMTSELQGGWIVGVDTVPPLRTHEDQYASGLGPSQINNLTLLAIQEGVTIINYYMLFGGTNFGTWAARGVATTYDYSAPIRENGGVGTKYLQVAGIAAMLKEHGPAIARSEKIIIHAVTGSHDVHVAARKSPDGGIYLFIRTDQHVSPRQGMAEISGDGLSALKMPLKIQYELEQFGSQILFLPLGCTQVAQGRWYPEIPHEPARPKVLPGAITITSVRTAADPLPTNFRPVAAAESLAGLGVYDSGFSYYRLRVPRPAEGGGEPHLIVNMPAGDGATAKIGDRIVYAQKGGESGNFAWPFPSVPKMVEATLLYENAGHPNFGETLENTYGIASAGLLNVSPPLLIRTWRMKVTPPPARPADAPIGPDIFDADWAKADCSSIDAKNMKPNQWAVFRTTVHVSAAAIREKRTGLCFGRIDGDGWVFVNGRLIGHSTSRLQMWIFDAAQALHPGRNIIAVLVHNNAGMGGIGQVAFTNASKLEGEIEFHGGPTGLARGFYRLDFDDSGWMSHTINSGTLHEALLVWQRMEFTLPRIPAGVWLPWCLKIQASGNGFIYLNGHALGRFWQHGKQREYFLPDCWLKPAGRNLIALCLRPLDRPCGVRSASVVAYTWYAEYRGPTN
jgi:hypothetical protein